MYSETVEQMRRESTEHGELLSAARYILNEVAEPDGEMEHGGARYGVTLWPYEWRLDRALPTPARLSIAAQLVMAEAQRLLELRAKTPLEHDNVAKLLELEMKALLESRAATHPMLHAEDVPEEVAAHILEPWDETTQKVQRQCILQLSIDRIRLQDEVKSLRERIAQAIEAECGIFGYGARAAYIARTMKVGE